MTSPQPAGPAPGPAPDGRSVPAAGQGRRRVGRYLLQDRIGEGGMGVVYLARADDGGRRVALKLLRPQVVGDDEGRERMAREVASLGKVRSPHVAEVLDADPWGETPYVVTRYVPGISLHQQVRQHGPLDEPDVLHVARVLLRAVSDVHSADVLHRDVKPSNVLLEGRSPVLIDFGLARLAEDPRLTATGWLLGTPGYLAPELVYGDDASRASDIHAWAATVGYAATGESPYGAGHPMAILDRLRRGVPRLDGVPDRMRPLLAACLAPEPLERPTSAEALDELARLDAPHVEVPEGPGRAPDAHTMPWQVAVAADLADSVTEVVRGPDGRSLRRPAPTTPYTVVTRPGAGPALPAAERPAPDPGRPSAPVGATDRAGPPATVPPPAAPVAEPAPGGARPARWQAAGPTLGARVRRGTLLAGLLTTVAAGFAFAPGLALVVVAVAVLALRGQSHTADAAWVRRLRRGRRRWYDAPLSVLGYPWHVVRGALGAVLLVTVATGAALLTSGAMVVLGAGETAALGAGGLVLGLAAWSGPGSPRVRVPVRRAVGRLSRGPWTGGAAVALALVATVLLLMLAEVRAARWDPLPAWSQAVADGLLGTRRDLPGPALPLP